MNDTIAKRDTGRDVGSGATRDPEDSRFYDWIRLGGGPRTFRLRVGRAETVRMLASFLDGDEGDARLMLDLAGGITLHCRGWLVGEVRSHA